MPPILPGGGPSSRPSGHQSPDSSFNRRRWIMLGLSLAMVIAVVIGLLVWKATSNHGPGAETTTPASDGVDRTVGLLREKDPVCDDWGKYADELAENTKQWGEIDKGIPASMWTPEQRQVVLTASEAMTAAANEFERILPQAQHVVLQELIAQAIVYWRAYVARIPDYVELDGKLAGVAANFGGAVTYMCSAIPLVPEIGGVEEGTSIAPHPAKLNPFMTDPDPACVGFLAVFDRQDSALRGWAAGDPTVPASKWSAKEHRLNLAAREVLKRNVEEVRNIAEAAENPILADLLLTYAAYVEAYANVIPDYSPDDDQLWKTSIFLAGGLSAACKARP